MIDSIGWDYKWVEGSPQNFLGFLQSHGGTPRKGGGLYALKSEFDGTLTRLKQPIVDIYKSYIQNAKIEIGDLTL